jgi:ABC-type lipoprotein export system ATPase subunit
MSMIHIESLVFQYCAGDFRLAIPKFFVDRGKKIALIGPSGSGKTTLLNLISGIMPPLSGSITVNGAVVSDLNDAQRRAYRISQVGFVFQDFELLDYLNVLDNILHPFRINNALKLTCEVRKRAMALAEEMDIADKLLRLSNNLSQGERQRTAICRAMVTQPSLILADEATGNLDPENKNRILDLLFDHAEQQKTTLIAVTHDHELLERFDRVVDFKDIQGKGVV